MTPERRAELIRSAKAKEAAAIPTDPALRAEMIRHGLVLRYELTVDEFRALFDTDDPPNRGGSASSEYWYRGY